MKLLNYRPWVALLLLSLSLTALWAAPDSNQAIRRFGLFVGANNGGKERTRLQWAVSDVQRMSQVMTELGGMQSNDVIILTDPRLSEVQQAIARMRVEVGNAQKDARRVEFMFYYSGHSDEDGLLLGEDRFAYKLLRQAINDVKADVSIAVLDSCASGAFTRVKGGVRIQPFLVDGSSDMKGYAFLTSASENESAQESDRLGASFFTYYLVSALRGAASTGNNRVTLNEAYKYAFNETLARTESTTSGPQHPSYDINLSGSGDLVLSDLSQPSASLVLNADLNGRVSIRDQKNYLVMEINKTVGRSLLIALQPGTYTLRIETNNGVYMAPARLNFHQEAQISTLDFQKTTLAANRTRGNDKVDSGSLEASESEAANSDRVLDIARARYRDVLRHPDRNGTSVPEQADNTSMVPNPAVPAINIPELPAGIGDWQIVDNSPEPGNQNPDLAASDQSDSAPAESTQAANDHLTRVPFHIGLVPGLSTARRARNVDSMFSFSPLISSVSRNGGVMVSGLINLNDGTEVGVQVAGILNTTSELLGAQFAGIADINSGSSLGAQVSGIFNISQGSLRGAQLAGLFNIAGIRVEGFQSAGLFNIASESFLGVQAAGLFNKAKTINGVQIAGLFNQADNAKGVMIAPINIARHLDGVPIGLVNIILDGIHDVGVWISGDDRIYLGVLNGSKTFYSIIFAGLHQTSIGTDTRGLVLGFGMGSRMNLVGPLYLDLEMSLKHAAVGNTDAERAASLFRQAPGENTAAEGVRVVPALRLIAGLDLKRVKLFAGLNVDIFAPAFMTPSSYYGYTPEYSGTIHLGTLPLTFNPQIQVGIALSI